MLEWILWLVISVRRRDDDAEEIGVWRDDDTGVICVWRRDDDASVISATFQAMNKAHFLCLIVLWLVWRPRELLRECCYQLLLNHL